MLPNGDIIAKRNRKRRERIESERRMVCQDCGIIMRDCESFSPDGEFYHRPTGCVNDFKTAYLRSLGRAIVKYKGTKWAKLFRPKKFRR
jgi:hypothetical protein